MKQQGLTILMFSLLAIAAAGCNGAGMAPAGPSGDGNQPLIVNPLGDGSITEPADGSGDAGGDTAKPDDGSNPPSGSSIACTFDKTVDAALGQPFSLVLTASGGSGDFLFSAADLPEGLSLSASNATIIGSPTKAGEFKAGITVKDIQGDRTEKCSLKITVQEALTITAVPVGNGILASASLKGSAQVVTGPADIWELSVNGTADGSTYHWSFSDTAHLCGSNANPTMVRASCSLPPSNGKVFYVWMDPKPSMNQIVTVSVSSDSATATASRQITFAAEKLEPTMTLLTATTTPGSDDTTPRKALLFNVFAATAPVDDAGTDCPVQIEFCKDAAMRHCTAATKLDNFMDNFEKGQADLFAPLSAPSGMNSEYKFFKISLLDTKQCGDDHDWYAQALDVLVLYEGQSFYHYFNPCVHKWVVAGESLKFSENDAAVCTIVSTSNIESASTDDIVWLNVQIGESYEDSFQSAALGMKNYDTGDEPHFFGTYKASDSAARIYGHLRLGHEENYDDFQAGDVTSYGDYIFNPTADPKGIADPFLKQAPNVFIQKDADGKGGGWHLANYEVFIFNPGKKNGGTFRHKVCEENRWLQDLGDAKENEEDGLITQKCQVPVSGKGSELITLEIGGHF